MNRKQINLLAQKHEYDLSTGGKYYLKKVHILLLVAFQVTIILATLLLDKYNLKLSIYSGIYFIAFYHSTGWFFDFLSFLLADNPAGAFGDTGSIGNIIYIISLYLLNITAYSAGSLCLLYYLVNQWITQNV